MKEVFSQMDEDLLSRINAIDPLDRDHFRILEDLQIEGIVFSFSHHFLLLHSGKADELLKVVKKNVGNERLVRFVAEFRAVQVPLPILFSFSFSLYSSPNFSVPSIASKEEMIGI